MMNKSSATGPVKAGFICLIIADIAIAVLGVFSWLFAGPLCLASFILSLVGISKGATKSGLILLILTLVTPAVIQLLWFLLISIGLNYGQSGNIPGLP